MNAPWPSTRGLSLVGYRGTGKSTVGRILADRVGRPFADADRRIEEMVGRPIREIFLDGGEAAFRQVETQAIAQLSSTLGGGIMATGGGAVLVESNRRVLRAFGLVVWLSADPDTLAARLSQSLRGVEDRPALTAAGTLAEIAEVLELRTPLYREVADVEVETAGKSVNQVVDSVLEAWISRAGGGKP